LKVNKELVFTAEELKSEEWVGVTDYPGYEVSNLGRFRSYWRPFGMVQQPRIKNVIFNNGRAKVSVHKPTGGNTLVFLARIVAKCFIGCADDQIVYHTDENPLNCRKENLVVVTREELGKILRCKRYFEDRDNSSLGREITRQSTRDKRYEIALTVKELREAGMTYREIGKNVGRSESGVCRIFLGLNNSLLQKALAK
jgi:hypothetical protein